MEKRIIGYKAIASTSASGLNELVNDAMTEGYTPVGTVAIEQPVAITDHGSKDLYESQSMYVQTMYMYEGAVNLNEEG